MTTIASRDGYVCVDSLVSDDTSAVGRIPKLYATKHGVMAWTGKASVAFRMIRYLADVANLMDIPEGDEIKAIREAVGGEHHSLVVFFKGVNHFIEFFAETMIPVEFYADFYANGTGGAYAKGAMAAGAGAHRAVEIAAQYDLATRGPFVLVQFPNQRLPEKGYEPLHPGMADGWTPR